jgi:hypothetical protein
MSEEAKPARSSRGLSRSVAFVVIALVIGVGALILVSIATIKYPPLAVYLRGSNELKSFYGKCMDIRRGQTEADVRAIMAEFRVASQTSNFLSFNTPTFSADFCSVRFSDEAVPHVTSVKFELD